MKFLKSNFLVLFIVFSTQAHAQDDGIIWFDYPEDGAVLGQGFDMLAGQVTYGSCVEFVPIQDPSQIVTYTFEEVNSSTEVTSRTNISASGSMQMAILNASARLSFLSDESFSLNTSKFLLSAEVTNSALFAAPTFDAKLGGQIAFPNLPAGNSISEDQLADYLSRSRITPTDNDPSTFDNVELCGQGFIAAIVSGAAVDAFLTMSDSNADSLADIRGSLEADIASVFKVSGSFEQQQTSSTIQDETSISVFRYGGAAGQIAFDLETLKESLRALAIDAATQPKPIRIGIVPYSRINTDLLEPVTASDFSSAISAYFLARDVFERSNDALDLLGNVPPQPESARVVGRRPIYFASDLSAYDTISTTAQRHAARISMLLRICRQDMISLNAIQPVDDDDVVANLLTAAYGTGNVIPTVQVADGAPALAADGVSLFQLSRAGHVDVSNSPASLEDADMNMGTLFNANMQVLQSPFPNMEDSDFDDVIALRFEACTGPVDLSANGGSYLTASGMYSVELLRRELMIRPLFWGEMGQRYREIITLKLELAAETQSDDGSIDGLTSDTVAAETFPTIEEYHTLFRASQIRRNICAENLVHPICATDSTWSESSVPVQADLVFDALQLRTEIVGNSP